MEEQIKIKRSDGTVEKVTQRELDTLNQSKHFKKQLHNITRQRNKFAFLLTTSWFLFAATALFYTLNNDTITSPSVPEPAANTLTHKDHQVSAAVKQKDESENPPALSVNNVSIQKPAKPVTEVKLEEQLAATPDITSPALPTFDQTQIITAIENWSRAWSNQSYTDYLAAYSKSFLPDNRYSGYDTWASSRKKKIESPAWIQVMVNDVEVFEPDSTGKVIAQFRQSYKSETFQDMTLKRLYIEHKEGHWLIVKELSIQ